VVGEASDDALPPLEAHNSAYYPNLNLGLLKNRSLLDMQFEDCGQRTGRNARVGQMRGILSITSQPVGHRESIVILAVEDLRSQYSGRNAGTQRADPEVRTFLVCPDDDLERVARGQVPVIERPDDFDSAQATQRPIEIAAWGTESMCEPNRIVGS
jgi:hypothetical protein